MRLSWRSAMGLLLGGVLLAQTNAANGPQFKATDTTTKGASGWSLSWPLETRSDTKGVTETDTGDRSSLRPPLRILTDTMGVDFNPYLSRVLPIVRQHWYDIIPESAGMKRGKVVLEFAILKDGSVARLKVVESSGDLKLDRPAYGSITGSNPFPPLPKEFSGPYLGLRVSYYYNLEFEKPGLSISPVESTVAVGSIVQFWAVDDDKDAAVTWSIIGCDDTCGTVSAAGFYTAPPKMPRSKVTIRATLVGDPNYSAGAMVTLVEPKH